MLMKRTLRKACSFVTRSWRDDEKIFLFHYRVQHLSSWREDLIPSCHLYYRIIACGKVFKMLDCFFWCLSMMMLNYFPFFCFNDIIFPVKTKSFQTIIKGFWNYLFPLVWCANVDLYSAVLWVDLPPDRTLITITIAEVMGGCLYL